MTKRQQSGILDVFNYANGVSKNNTDKISKEELKLQEATTQKARERAEQRIRVLENDGAYHYGIIHGIKTTLQALGYVAVVGNDGYAAKIIKPEER